MNLQYISDSNGTPTGVFIPIKDWNTLIEKYNELNSELPLTQEMKKELDRRLESIKNNPEQCTDFDTEMDNIEQGL